MRAMAKPARFYAVNDRPVALVESPSGTAECLVFDFVSGNLIPDRSYLTEVAGGEHEELTQQEFAHLVGERRVEVLQIWAERLCRATSGSAEDLLTAIGASMKPAPLGAIEVRVRGGDVGAAKIELELAPNTISRGELDAMLGDAKTFAPNVLAYEVAQEAAPYRCTVFASFAEPPRDGTSVKSIVLRLDAA
jgi:hypothetical protein